MVHQECECETVFSKNSVNGTQNTRGPIPFPLPSNFGFFFSPVIMMGCKTREERKEEKIRQEWKSPLYHIV